MAFKDYMDGQLKLAQEQEERSRRTLSKLAMVAGPEAIALFAKLAIDAINYTDGASDYQAAIHNLERE